MPNAIDDFDACIRDGAHTEHAGFASAFRGPDCQFGRVVAELLVSGTRDAANKFAGTLDFLDGWFSGNPTHEVLLNDRTLAKRWIGISHAVRSRVVAGDGSKLKQHTLAAKVAFDDAWNQAIESFGAGWPQPRTTDLSAASAESGLYSAHGNDHEPWTAGSWMVWDLLTEMNPKNAVSVVERTPLLLGIGGKGYVMSLVVELLPGPAGLVTPNWWKLGLTAFPNDNREQYLLGAVQRAMTLAMPAHHGFRARWHLESNDEETWRLGLKGRSVECAAAVVVLAAFEQFSEKKGQSPEYKPEPVLDAQAAVTAAVAHQNGDTILTHSLERVTEDTLPAKLTAAQSRGIDRVVVASDQRSVVTPFNLYPARTVGDALDELRAVNRAFDELNAGIRSRFEAEWSEEPTPK